jgi:hypothetical protein
MVQGPGEIMADVQLKMEIDRADMDKVHAMLGDLKGAPDAVFRRAVNKTLDGIKTEAVNAIAEEITPTKTAIRKTFTTKKAGVDAWVRSRGGPLNLINYKARQTKDGVTVQIGKKDKRVLFPSAFISVAKAGGTTKAFFSRLKPPYKTKASPKLPWKRFAPKHMRLPIRSLSGPAIPDIWKRKPVFDKVQAAGVARLSVNIDREINYELSKHK